MTDFLARLVAERRADVQRALRERSSDVRPAGVSVRPDRALGVASPFGAALAERRRTGRLAVIAEVKRRSPVSGDLGSGIDVAAQARAYEGGGAAAISVLTEPRHWGGSLDDLRHVRDAVRIPVLVKDVVVHPSQIDEAQEAGADAILLIAEALHFGELVRYGASGEMLPDGRIDELADLLAHARRRGIEALVEAHEPAAFGRAVASGAWVVGINARDLRDPQRIDRSRARLLHTFAAPHQILVAESGLETVEDAQALPARVDAVLVGTAFMRSTDPGALVRAMAAIRVAPARRSEPVVVRSRVGR